MVIAAALVLILCVQCAKVQTKNSKEAAINVPKTELQLGKLDKNPTELSKVEQKRLRLSEIKCKLENNMDLYLGKSQIIYQNENGRLEVIHCYYKFFDKSDGTGRAYLVSYDSRGNYVDCLEAVVHIGDFEQYAVVEDSTVRIELSILNQKLEKMIAQTPVFYRIMPDLKFEERK